MQNKLLDNRRPGMGTQPFVKRPRSSRTLFYVECISFADAQRQSRWTPKVSRPIDGSTIKITAV
jgi:hypothetical protein